MSAAPGAGRLRRARADVAVVFWLKGEDLNAATRRPWLVATAGCGYAAGVLVLLAGAAWLHHTYPSLVQVSSTILIPVWLLWALLPAVGVGGGSAESAGSLSPYPVRARVHLGSSWLSAVSDLHYLIPVPAVVAALVATYGPGALVPAAAFVAGASALGQLLAWAVARRGPGVVRPGAGQPGHAGAFCRAAGTSRAEGVPATTAILAFGRPDVRCYPRSPEVGSVPRRRPDGPWPSRSLPARCSRLYPPPPCYR